MLGVGGSIALSTGLAALGSAASGVSAGVMNRRGEKFARDQMKWQEKQTQLARDWQLQMWNKENAYNSASEQRKRWEQAGFNPYMMQSDSGNAGSVGSVSAPSGVATPNYQSGDYSAISAAGASAADMLYNRELQKANVEKVRNESEKSASDVRLQKIDELTRGAENLQRLKGLVTDNQYKKLLAEYQEYATEILKDTKEDAKESVRLDNDSKRADIDLKIQQAATEHWNALSAKFGYEKLPERFNNEMQLYAAQIFQAVASGKLSQAQASESFARKLLTEAQTNGVKISNKIAFKTAGSLISSMNAENWSKLGYYGIDSETQYGRGNQKWLNDVSGNIPVAIGRVLGEQLAKFMHKGY